MDDLLPKRVVNLRLNNPSLSYKRITELVSTRDRPVTRSMVARYLKNAGVQTGRPDGKPVVKRGPTWNQEHKNKALGQARKLIRQGQNYTQAMRLIAEEFGINVATLYRWKRERDQAA